MSSKTKYMVNQATTSLNLMRSNYQDRDNFIREFQHFISNTRSIIDYLKNEYSHIVGSEEFIGAYRRHFYDDAHARFFIDARNFSIHVKPIPIIVKDVDANGRNSDYCYVDFNGFEPSVDPHFDSQTAQVEKYYFAEYPDKEVIECSEKYLNQIVSLVTTCEIIFGIP